MVASAWMLVAAGLGFGTAAAAAEETPVHGLILTWKQDPTTTIVIDWHEETPISDPLLMHRKMGATEWKRATPEVVDFPFSDDWKIYRTELTGLEPGTFYEFRPHGRSEPYKFRTMPADLERPLRVVVGGDIAFRDVPAQMNREVAKLEPDVILWGGDYAYSDAKKEYLWKEVMMHNSIRDDLVTAERRVFPVLAAIGNHEVMGSSAPYYFATFAWPGNPPYGVMDFSDYLSVVILDSNHIAKVPGEQTDWLGKVLNERSGNPHRIIFPVYHIPAYPSVREDERTTFELREHWVPLFEKAGLSVAFEHHDHAYKRTHPLLAGEIQDDASKGITYLGDGAWGASTRAVKSFEERPYLYKAERTNHVFVVDIAKEGPLKFKAINHKGEVIDEFELPRRRP